MTVVFIHEYLRIITVMNEYLIGMAMYAQVCVVVIGV